MMDSKNIVVFDAPINIYPLSSRIDLLYKVRSCIEGQVAVNKCARTNLPVKMIVLLLPLNGRQSKVRMLFLIHKYRTPGSPNVERWRPASILLDSCEYQMCSPHAKAQMD